MSTTATQLRALLKINLHNDQALTDPTDYDNFLTYGQEMIVRDSPGTLGTKEGTIATAAGTRIYSLATDFYQMRGVFFADNGYKLDCIPVNEFMETVERLPTIASAAPLGYCIVGYDEGTPDAWRLKFDRNPDAIYAYKYWYYWMPAAISGTAVPAIAGIGFGRLLVAAATMIGSERNDSSSYQLAASIYEREIVAYRAFNAQSPDYRPVINPGGMDRRSGSTLRLGDHFPIDY